MAECKQYDQVIAHVAHQRIAIDLDDGVNDRFLTGELENDLFLTGELENDLFLTGELDLDEGVNDLFLSRE